MVKSELAVGLSSVVFSYLNFEVQDLSKVVLHNKPRDVSDFNLPSDHSEQVNTPGVYEIIINFNWI